MEFIETPVFTKRLGPLLSDARYQELQVTLAENPEAGKVIPGTGGLRKLRWATKGHGKRGGVRVIYYYDSSHSGEVCFMLVIYAKNERDDLSRRELQVLSGLVKTQL